MHMARPASRWRSLTRSTKILHCHDLCMTPRVKHTEDQLQGKDNVRMNEYIIRLINYYLNEVAH